MHHIHSIFSHVENARFWINVSLCIKLVKQCIHSNVRSCLASPCTVKSASKHTQIEALRDSSYSIFNFRRIISCLQMRHDYMVLSLILKEKCFTNYCFLDTVFVPKHLPKRVKISPPAMNNDWVFVVITCFNHLP